MKIELKWWSVCLFVCFHALLIVQFLSKHFLLPSPLLYSHWCWTSWLLQESFSLQPDMNGAIFLPCVDFYFYYYSRQSVVTQERAWKALVKLINGRETLFIIETEAEWVEWVVCVFCQIEDDFRWWWIKYFTIRGKKMSNAREKATYLLKYLFNIHRHNNNNTEKMLRFDGVKRK